MKAFWIVWIGFLIQLPLFSQVNQAKPAYRFGIIQQDSINYLRTFITVDDSIIKSNEIVSLKENSLIRILNSKIGKDEILIENFTTFSTDGSDENLPITSINRDTVKVKNDDILLFDSLKIQDRYFSEILKPLYGNSDQPSIIYSINYDETNRICFMSYETYPDHEVWAYTALFKVVNNKPVSYIGASCGNCKYDIFKNYVVIYNKERAEIFDTLDYQFDIKSNTYKQKWEDSFLNPRYPHTILSAGDYGRYSELLYNKSKHEFILKSKDKKEDAYNYVTYRILNGIFIK